MLTIKQDAIFSRAVFLRYKKLGYFHQANGLPLETQLIKKRIEAIMPKQCIFFIRNAVENLEECA